MFTRVEAIVVHGPLATRTCKALVPDVVGRPLSEALQADTVRLIADIRSNPE
ncbi:MAG: hypothetical protein V4739_01385 [Pseudomonadota bacterium]